MKIDFTPRTWADLIGNKTAIDKVKNWLPSNNLLIFGDAGIGKTSTINVWAKYYVYDIYEVNASDSHDLESLKSIRSKVRLNLFKPTLFLLDEADGIEWWRHGNFVFDMIDQSKHPFVLIANDPYQIKRSHEIWKKKTKKPSILKEVRFWKPRIQTVVARLKALEKRYGVKFNFSNVSTDIRASINSLQAASDKYTPEQNVFDIIRELFLYGKTTNVDLKKHAYWINESIPKVYHGYNITKAYSVLNTAVICNNPIPLRLLPRLQYVRNIEYPSYLRRSSKARQKLKQLVEK